MLAKIVEVKGNKGVAVAKNGTIIMLDYTSGVIPYIGALILISDGDTFKSNGYTWAKRAFYVQ